MVADSAGPLPDAVLLAGLGVTNTAAARALTAHGHRVVIIDDGDPADGSQLAEELGSEFHRAPTDSEVADLVARTGAVLPAPGLPESHRVFGAARAAGVGVISEFDLAAAWDDRPVLAITGTNGKTTVATLVAEMLEASGIATAAVGNLDVPLVAAIEDARPECFVVEASSFRLGHSRHFAPRVGTWLNFAEDHLDIHRDLEAYRSAKARIWSGQGPGDTAVVNASDPTVLAAEPREAGVRVWCFGPAEKTGGRTCAFHVDGGRLWWRPGAQDDPVLLAETAELWSDLPHDRLNALAASATALAGGATVEGVRTALANFGGLPHRVQLVGETGGVRYYDDSKATAPHATLAALEGFERVVLIAGGRNKGLDLGLLASATTVVGVVGIGEAGGDVVAAFDDVPSSRADSMAAAVDAAASMAVPGEVVLLSPGCASFDWYGSYRERGDDFTVCVREMVRSSGGGAP